MEIDYDNTEVEKLFNDFNLMKKKTDAVFTRQVKKRYDQIKSFDNFADFLISGLGKPHPLYENLKGCYGIHVSKNKRLIVCPLSKDTSIESLRTCKRIIIKGVVDYHGSKTTIYIP